MNAFEDELRRALDTEASTVDIRPDALPQIRQRIADRRPFGGLMLAFGTGAAALATVVAVFVSSGSCAPRRPGPPIAGPVTSGPVDPTSAAPVPGEPVGPTPTAATQPGQANVYVYYIGLDRGRPRLYREVHSVPVAAVGAAAKIRAAVTEMLAGRPLDPDYQGGWPAGLSVRDVRVEGGVIVVDLSGVGANTVGSEFAQAAVQQLVWTASAQLAGNPPVRLLVGGARVAELWGHVAVGGDLRRAPAVSTLGLVWVIDPQQGAVVGRTVSVYVAGIAHEATVQVRVRRGGTVVHQNFYTLDKGPPEQGTVRVTLTLPAGTYTIEAYESSAEDGSEQHLDNHQFTVR